jgi:hypothetical protein
MEDKVKSTKNASFVGFALSCSTEVNLSL